MKLKKKLRNFFTLTRKANGGFTLVELVVVIAIMGILAGVGTVGYSGYVKNANKKADITTVKQVTRAVQVAGNSYSSGIDSPQVSAEGLQVPVGFIVLSDQQFSYNVATDTVTVGSGDYTNVLLPEGNTTNDGKIEDILAAAFGSNYGAEVKLRSNTWKGTNIPALYADSAELFEQIKTVSNLLYSVQGIDAIANKISRNDYGSGLEVVTNIADLITGHYTESQFVDAWIAANGSADGTSYAFGLNALGMETYTAVRAAYNEAVGSYVEEHSAATHTTTIYDYGAGIDIFGFGGWEKCEEKAGTIEQASTHADKIRNYSESLSVGNLVVSDTIQSSLFATFNADGTFASRGSDAYGGTYNSGWISYYSKTAGNLADGTQLCPTCAKLVAEYCASPEAKEDARAFYKTMKTVDDTSAVADDWTFYDDYVGDFASLYDSLDVITNKLTENGSAIVITVYQDPLTGMLNSEVSVSLEE